MKTRKAVISSLIAIAAVLLASILGFFLLPYKSIMDVHNEPAFPIVETPEVVDPSELLVDRILKKLEFGNIAFNAPRTVNIDDTVIIQLLLGFKTPIDELKKQIEAAGEKEGAHIRVSNVMEARLTGTNFAINAVTSEEQAVTRTDVTEWKWEVVPKKKGRHHLHLTLSVRINVDGFPTLRSIRTFDKNIEVKVTWDQQASSFIKANWDWLWAAILVPVAGWLWKKKKGAKHSAES